MRRHSVKRDANEPEIVRALEDIGCTVFRLHAPVDLLVGYRRCNFLLEVKTAEGTETKDQVEFFKRWRGAATIVRSVDDAIAAVTGKAHN